MTDIYTDASGKTGRYCYVVDEPSNKKVRIFEKKGITNNEGEYLAIIAALKENTEKNISIYSDSQLVVNQLNHEFAIKNDKLRDLAQEIWKLSEDRNIHFYWIPRNKNKAGKVLG
ncbi:MAG: reverse transcriptase-like protein [Candidatus Aenigmatarchaeota archaeon]|nr:reverse transcriptase-like protein [Candidatus Aenigmarchaeota archaeon]